MREWARMGGILQGAWQVFRFQSLSETKLIKNCRLPSWFKKRASWFRKRVSWYMTWNTWELTLNSTILTHSTSKLMLNLSMLIVNWWIWIIKLHLRYFVTFGVAYVTLLNTFSRNKRRQNCGLKVLLFDLKRSNVMFSCPNLNGSSYYLQHYWPLQQTSEPTKPQRYIRSHHWHMSYFFQNSS